MHLRSIQEVKLKPYNIQPAACTSLPNQQCQRTKIRRFFPTKKHRGADPVPEVPGVGEAAYSRTPAALSRNCHAKISLFLSCPESCGFWPLLAALLLCLWPPETAEFGHKLSL